MGKEKVAEVPKGEGLRKDQLKESNISVEGRKGKASRLLFKFGFSPPALGSLQTDSGQSVTLPSLGVKHREV